MPPELRMVSLTKHLNRVPTEDLIREIRGEPNALLKELAGPKLLREAMQAELAGRMPEKWKFESQKPNPPRKGPGGANTNRLIATPNDKINLDVPLSRPVMEKMYARYLEGSTKRTVDKEDFPRLHAALEKTVRTAKARSMRGPEKEPEKTLNELKQEKEAAFREDEQMMEEERKDRRERKADAENRKGFEHKRREPDQTRSGFRPGVDASVPKEVVDFKKSAREISNPLKQGSLKERMKMLERELNHAMQDVNQKFPPDNKESWDSPKNKKMFKERVSRQTDIVRATVEEGSRFADASEINKLVAPHHKLLANRPEYFAKQALNDFNEAKKGGADPGLVKRLEELAAGQADVVVHVKRGEYTQAHLKGLEMFNLEQMMKNPRNQEARGLRDSYQRQYYSVVDGGGQRYTKSPEYDDDGRPVTTEGQDRSRKKQERREDWKANTDQNRAIAQDAEWTTDQKAAAGNLGKAEKGGARGGSPMPRVGPGGANVNRLSGEGRPPVFSWNPPIKPYVKQVGRLMTPMEKKAGLIWKILRQLARRKLRL